MDILTTPVQAHEWVRQTGSDTRGLVPTMGALHRGHESLIQRSRQENQKTVLSIFVNPTQFNNSSDFESYPRTLEVDMKIAQHHGVDALYVPSTSSMYPDNFQSFVEPGSSSTFMEGQERPGHFRGVTTVVAKLFHAISPHNAYFGKKDFQQLAVIKQMVRELDFSVNVIGSDTVREDDGLAMSSRNVRLSALARQDAPIIFQALTAVSDKFTSGERDSELLLQVFQSTIANSSRFRLEYATVSDAVTLEPIHNIETDAVLCVAGWYDDVRLIDNIELPIASR